jgi:hypothetical protein
MIGERNPNDVVFYPDSGKIGVSMVDKVLDLNAVKDYRDDV